MYTLLNIAMLSHTQEAQIFIRKGVGGVIHPPPLTATYFPADLWIFHLKTTYPLFSSVFLSCLARNLKYLFTGSVLYEKER